MHRYALHLGVLLSLAPLPAIAYTLPKGRPIVGNAQANLPKVGPNRSQGKPIVGSGPIYQKPKLVKPKPKPKPRPVAVPKQPVTATAPKPKQQTAAKPKPKPRPVTAAKPTKRRVPKQQWSRPKRKRRVVTKPRQRVRPPTQQIYVQPKLAPKPPPPSPVLTKGIQPLTPEQAERFLPGAVQKAEEMLWPLAQLARISSAFGWRIHPISKARRFHSGTDLAAPTGTPVLAAYSGEVITAGPNGGYGLSVLLNHQGGSFQTRYAHLSKLLVQSGEYAQRGQVIGRVGSTGRSTGPHLHIELRQRQPDSSYAPVDPGRQLIIAKVRETQKRHQAKQQRRQ